MSILGGFFTKKIGKAIQKKFLGFDPAKKMGKMKSYEGRGSGSNARDQKDFEVQRASVDYNLPVNNPAQDRIVQQRNNVERIDPTMNEVGVKNSTIEVFNRNNPGV